MLLALRVARLITTERSHQGDQNGERHQRDPDVEAQTALCVVLPHERDPDNAKYAGCARERVEVAIGSHKPH